MKVVWKRGYPCISAHNDRITQAPTLERYGKDAQATRAWLLDLDREALGWIRAKAPLLFGLAMQPVIDAPNRNASVACWLIEAPWAHPFWHSYRLSMVHLRDDDTIPPPARATMIYLPGATHELVLEALDPDKPRQVMLLTGECTTLTPANFAAQIIEPSDEAAASRVAEAVKLIIAGVVSPDTDFNHQWIELFGDNMVRKGANA